MQRSTKHWAADLEYKITYKLLTFGSCMQELELNVHFLH